jgi:hypothetical protein
MSRGSRVGYGRERPPVQRSNNRPLMWNCCRQLKDRPGQPGGPSMFLAYAERYHTAWGQHMRNAR